MAVLYDPVRYIELFGEKIYTEPIAMVVAFVILILYVYFHLKKENIEMSTSDFVKFFTLTIIFSLIGGRVWFFTFKKGWSWSFFNPFRAGLVSVGMLIGGIVGVLVFVLYFMDRERWQIKFAKIADVLAPGVALWIFIYRLFGCSIFLVCTPGTKTDVPWALVWVKDGVPRHPITFYLAFSALLIFLLLRLFFSYEKE